MNEEQKYKCPKCGCEDRIGYVPPFGSRTEEDLVGTLYEKKDGTWRREKETYVVLMPRYFCPECGEWLPLSAARRWEEEPRKE